MLLLGLGWLLSDSSAADDPTGRSDPYLAQRNKKRRSKEAKTTMWSGVVDAGFF